MSDPFENTPPVGVAYGYCWCGCGQRTSVSRVTRARDGQVAGQPKRYINGHWLHAHQGAITVPNPSGKCLCGCGKTTTRAQRTYPERGVYKGEYHRYITGHAQAGGVTEQLRAVLSSQETRDPSYLIAEAARLLAVPPSEILSRNRALHVSDARHLAVALLLTNGHLPTQVAKIMRRDHSTVIASAEVVLSSPHLLALARQVRPGILVHARLEDLLRDVLVGLDVRDALSIQAVVLGKVLTLPEWRTSRWQCLWIRGLYLLRELPQTAEKILYILRTREQKTAAVLLERWLTQIAA